MRDLLQRRWMKGDVRMWPTNTFVIWKKQRGKGGLLERKSGEGSWYGMNIDKELFECVVDVTEGDW